MATKGEQSVLNVLYGGDLLAGYEKELARPNLWNSPSGNYGPTAEIAENLDQRRRGDLAALAESAVRWERHLEPGVPGVAMRQEPNSGTYTPWIVCPVAGAYLVHREHAAGQLAAERARWWCRAWLTWSALTMGTKPGALISDRDDPPGEYRPGPVRATSAVDETPWTGAPPSMARRNKGILPTVAVGERSWQRSHAGDDDLRLCRGYLDQSQIAQIVQLALGIDFQQDLSESGDWPARFLSGIRRVWGAATPLFPLSPAERNDIYAAWLTKSPEAVARVVPFLEGWRFAWDFTLARTEGGLWSLGHTGGHTSTDSTYGAALDEELGEVEWLACGSGMRKSKTALDAIVEGRGWESGDRLFCERSDNRYGARTIKKSPGAELWRLDNGPDGYRFTVAGRPVTIPVGDAPMPQPEPTPQPDATPPAADDRPEILPHEGGWLVLWRGRAEVVGWPAEDGRTMVTLT